LELNGGFEAQFRISLECPGPQAIDLVIGHAAGYVFFIFGLCVSWQPSTPRASCEGWGRLQSEGAMKALIIYVCFRDRWRRGAAGIGYYVEKETSSAVSLIVFLTLFFANFVISWIATIFVMDGSLKNAQSRQDS